MELAGQASSRHRAGADDSLPGRPGLLQDADNRQAIITPAMPSKGLARGDCHHSPQHSFPCEAHTAFRAAVWLCANQQLLLLPPDLLRGCFQLLCPDFLLPLALPSPRIMPFPALLHFCRYCRGLQVTQPGQPGTLARCVLPGSSVPVCLALLCSSLPSHPKTKGRCCCRCCRW